MSEHSFYGEDVKSDAEEIIREMDHWSDDPEDKVHEWADSAVTYTMDCLNILQNSRRQDAMFEHAGSEALLGCDTFHEVVRRMAFYAYRADLNGALFDLSDEDRLAIREEGICECCGEVFPVGDLSDEREGCEGQTLCEDCYEDGLDDEDEGEE